MNKILIGISILVGFTLIAINIAISGRGHIIIGYGSSGTLTILSIIIGIIFGFGLKGLMTDKSGNDYNDDDEGINF